MVWSKEGDHRSGIRSGQAKRPKERTDLSTQDTVLYDLCGIFLFYDDHLSCMAQRRSGWGIGLAIGNRGSNPSRCTVKCKPGQVVHTHFLCNKEEQCAAAVVRTSVCSWRTFPDLRLIHGWRVTTSWVRRPLWVNQLGQLSFHPSGVGIWVVSHVIYKDYRGGDH